MARRRIVVVTYFFPPSTAVGGARWAAMARHLRAIGHEVTVVTSRVHGEAADDQVVPTWDLAGTDVLRRLLRRPALAQPGAAVADTPAPGLLTRVLVPDAHVVSWLPGALSAVRRLLRRERVDALVTSGPPNSAHLVGLALGRERPAWLADFRDGWRFEPLAPPWPTRAQRTLDARLEAAVARRADAVLGATRPIAEDFAARLGARASWVPNGWDPGMAAGAGPGRSPVARDGAAALAVHTGTLSGPRGRDPRPLLRALRRVNDERVASSRGVRLVLAGRPTVEDERLLSEAALGDDVLRHVGLLSRRDAVALQREADALVLLTGTHRSEATGKLFEYLHAGRPILALARDNEAQHIVEQTRTGLTVDPTDEAAIVAGLRRVADGTLGELYAPRELERFTYPGPAEEVAALVEEALARRL
jgi:glycosyltransferase involved in cell wall biosynthesis